MELAIDSRTGVSLADYTWLSEEHRDAFQATLESDEGIAEIHFLSEVEKMSRRRCQNRIIAVSSKAIYFCTLQANISRCILLDDIEEVFVCDEWMCLSIPTEYDVIFRFLPMNGGSPFRNQSFFLEIVNSLRSQLNCPPVHARTVSSIHSLSSRRIERPADFREVAPPPIPVLDWETLVKRIQNPEVLIRYLLPPRAAACSSIASQRFSPRKAPSPRRTYVPYTRRDISPIRSAGAAPRRPVVASPVRPKAPAQASFSGRFDDPCLGLVWEELMAQRTALEGLCVHVEQLVRGPFTPDVRPVQKMQSPRPQTAEVPDPLGVMDDLTPFQRELGAKIRPWTGNVVVTPPPRPVADTSGGHSATPIASCENCAVQSHSGLVEPPFHHQHSTRASRLREMAAYGEIQMSHPASPPKRPPWRFVGSPATSPGACAVTKRYRNPKEIL